MINFIARLRLISPIQSSRETFFYARLFTILTTRKLRWTFKRKTKMCWIIEEKQFQMKFSLINLFLIFFLTDWESFHFFPAPTARCLANWIRSRCKLSVEWRRKSFSDFSRASSLTRKKNKIERAKHEKSHGMGSRSIRYQQTKIFN